ncbi:MAG: hypothetical protein ABIH23_07235 [bacterium]
MAGKRIRKKQKETGRSRYWRGMVGAWEKSGVTQRAFCEEKGISLSAFCWWRCRFRREERESRGAKGGRKRTRKTALPSSSFLPVRIESGLLDSLGEGVIEVVLRNGRCLRVPRDFNAEALAGLARELESRC